MLIRVLSFHFCCQMAVMSCIYLLLTWLFTTFLGTCPNSYCTFTSYIVKDDINVNTS
jgi:hypothetical protein